MLMSDLLRALRDGGIDARHWHVRHLIAAGLVEPPQRDSTGRFQFADADYARIRLYLQARGRRRRARGAEVGGCGDATASAKTATRRRPSADRRPTHL